MSSVESQSSPIYVMIGWIRGELFSSGYLSNISLTSSCKGLVSACSDHRREDCVAYQLLPNTFIVPLVIHSPNMLLPILECGVEPDSDSQKPLLILSQSVSNCLSFRAHGRMGE